MLTTLSRHIARSDRSIFTEISEIEILLQFQGKFTEWFLLVSEMQVNNLDGKFPKSNISAQFSPICAVGIYMLRSEGKKTLKFFAFHS